MGRKKSKKNKSSSEIILTLIIVVIIAIASYLGTEEHNIIKDNKILYNTSFDLSSIPEFSIEPYVVLNDNKPEFKEEDLRPEAFESYSELDSLGRCRGMYFMCR